VLNSARGRSLAQIRLRVGPGVEDDVRTLRAQGCSALKAGVSMGPRRQLQGDDTEEIRRARPGLPQSPANAGLGTRADDALGHRPVPYPRTLLPEAPYRRRPWSSPSACQPQTPSGRPGRPARLAGAAPDPRSGGPGRSRAPHPAPVGARRSPAQRGRGGRRDGAQKLALAVERRYRAAREHEAVEVEALGQQTVTAAVRNAIEALLPAPLADVQIRESASEPGCRCSARRSLQQGCAEGRLPAAPGPGG
jgi:hypothetical protein